MNSLEHVSATMIKAFRACPRKWYFKYVLGHTTPSSPAMDFGKECHDALESSWLRPNPPGVPSPILDIVNACNEITGRDAWHSKARFEGRVLTLPGFQAHVEVPTDGVTIRGLPLKGFIDLLKIDFGRSRAKVLDYKTMSTRRYALSPEALTSDVQMILYAFWTLETFDVSEVTLSHLQIVKKTSKVHLVESEPLTRDMVLRNIEPVFRTIDAMKQAALVPLEQVPRNERACWDFGRRCSHSAPCTQTMYLPGDEAMSFWDTIDQVSSPTPPDAQPNLVPGPVPSRPLEVLSSCTPVIMDSLTKLGITTLQALKEFSDAGSLTSVPGIGPKKAQNIQEELHFLFSGPVAKPAKPPQDTAPTPATWSLYVDCQPSHSFVYGRDILLPAILELQEAKSVPHWSLLEYGEGAKVLCRWTAAQRDLFASHGHVVLRTCVQEEQAILSTLLQSADRVVWGTK